VLGGLTIAVSTALGLLIAVRRPGNPMGWILLANGAVFALAGVAEAYAQYAVLESPGALPGGAWAVLWYEQGWPVDFAPLVAIALLFPDGRLPSPRWRPIAIGMIVTLVAAQALTLFEGAQFGAPFEAVENPVPAVPGMLTRRTPSGSSSLRHSSPCLDRWGSRCCSTSSRPSV
jgi:hypothetical protein